MRILYLGNIDNQNIVKNKFSFMILITNIMNKIYLLFFLYQEPRYYLKINYELYL